MLREQVVQCRCAASVAAKHRNLVALCLLKRASYHFVGNGVDKQNEHVRISEFFANGSALLGEHLRLTAVILANSFVLANHSLVAANNHNAHFFLPG